MRFSLTQPKTRASTNINKALIDALAFYPDSKRLKFLIFLTDGLPTHGVISTEKIVENVAKVNSMKKVSIYSFHDFSSYRG